MKRLALLLIMSIAANAHAGIDDAKALYDKGQYAEALKEYQVYAERGFPMANFMLALMYTNGEGVPRNPALAIDYGSKAADAGHVGAIAIIANLYASEKSGVKDAAKAVEWFEKGIALKDTNSIRTLGLHYLRGELVPRNIERALALLKDAVDRDDVLAMYELGLVHEFGKGVPRDVAKARAWYEKMLVAPPGSYRNKVPAQMVRLAGLLDDHSRGNNDLMRAARLFEDAAKEGHLEATSRLGWMYEHGRGVTKDYGRALQLYQTAADGGYGPALFNGGRMLEHGRGIPQDNSEAFNWYADGASKGHAPSMFAVARFYDQGKLGAPDPRAALEWHCKISTTLKEQHLMELVSAAIDTPKGKAAVAYLTILDKCRKLPGQIGVDGAAAYSVLVNRVPAVTLAAVPKFVEFIDKSGSLTKALQEFRKADTKADEPAPEQET